MKKFLSILVLVLAMTFTACTTFKATGLSYGDFDGKVVDRFETEITVWKFVGYSAGMTLFDLGQDEVDNAVNTAIRSELRRLNADAAIDVTIEEEASLLDLFINYISGCILAPSTVRISGIAIKY